MSKKPQTFHELLSLWETPKALSEDTGIAYVSAQMMKRRKSIGAAHWPTFVEAAAAKGVTITLDDLARMRIDASRGVAA